MFDHDDDETCALRLAVEEQAMYRIRRFGTEESTCLSCLHPRQPFQLLRGQHTLFIISSLCLGGELDVTR